MTPTACCRISIRERHCMYAVCLQAHKIIVLFFVANPHPTHTIPETKRACCANSASWCSNHISDLTCAPCSDTHLFSFAIVMATPARPCVMHILAKSCSHTNTDAFRFVMSTHCISPNEVPTQVPIHHIFIYM